MRFPPNLALALLLLAEPLAAQEPETENPNYGVSLAAPRPQRSSHFLGRCGGLILCVGGEGADAKKAGTPELLGKRDGLESPLGRFTRLAGIFIGRIQAAQIGQVRLRIKLALD